MLHAPATVRPAPGVAGIPQPTRHIDVRILTASAIGLRAAADEDLDDKLRAPHS